MYDKNPNKETLAEEILCEMLQFLKFKIRNHKLTVTDSEAIHRIFDGIDITGTADDFAKFYGQHPVTVRSVICRKYIGKPRRVVLYSFNKFRRLIPSSWRKYCCTDAADSEIKNKDVLRGFRRGETRGTLLDGRFHPGHL